MNGENIMKYIHWIVIGIIVLVFLIFVAPKVIPELFRAIFDLFGGVLKSAKDVGGGIKDSLPKK